jgi:hypothetical protein
MKTPQKKRRAASQPSRQAFSGAVNAANQLQVKNIRFTRFAALTSVGSENPLPSTITARIGFTRPKVSKRDRTVIITTTFLMRVRDKAIHDGEPIVDFRATTELTYAVRENSSVSESDIEEFAQVNAPFNAWSYWRELYQSTLARFQLPQTPLPLFRIQDAAALMVEREADNP